MIFNGMEIMKIANDFGYFDRDYNIEKDDTVTFQEYLLISMLHCGWWESEEFDPDKVYNDKTIFNMKEIYDSDWYAYYVGSKKNPCIIDKPWDQVLVNKRKSK